jgi:DNA-binding NarL/FixJ family response regulator
MQEKIRILLADDHPVVRDGLAAMLRTQPDLEVVGEVSDGEQALLQARNDPPDVILLDLEMPRLDGVETLRALRRDQPQIKVIVFTAFDDDERIVGAVQAGAQGYLLKGAPREEVFEAIRVVHGGGSLLQPLVASKLMRHMSASVQAAGALVEPLTQRETEVLELLSAGMTNKAIAERLVVSERTVKFHVSSILGKLGANNRTEAVSLAAQKGLIEL